MKRILYIFLILTVAALAISAEPYKKPKKEEEKKTEEKNAEEKNAEGEKSLKRWYEETVVVTASMDEEFYWDTTVNMTVFTKEDIEKTMLMDVNEILRYVPGSIVQQAGAAGKVSTIRLRGATPGHVLLLIDGIPMNDPALGLPNFAPLTLSGLDRIEIVKGVHSPLYGSSASGGVVHMITEKGDGPFRIKFFGETDYSAIYDANISIDGRTGIFSYYTDYQTIRSDGQYDNDNYKNNTFNIRLDFDFNEKTRLQFNTHYIDSLVGIPIEIFSGSVTEDENSKQSDIYFLGSSIFETRMLEVWETRFSFGFVSHNQKFKDPADDGELFAWPVDYKTETRTYNFNFTNNIHLGSDDIFTIGLETRNMSVTSTDQLTNMINYEEDVDLFGFYLQNRLVLNDNFYLTASVRWDDFGDFGDSFNPRLAAAMMLSPTSKLTFSYSTGFRIPSLNELYYPYYGNPDLLPEESKGFEVGFDQFIGGENVHFNFVFFATDYTNMIGYDFDTFMANNISEASISGFETNIDFKTPAGFSGKLGYTYTHSEDVATGEPLLRVPESQLFINLRLATGDYTLDLFAKYVSEQLDNHVEGFPLYNEGYFVVDLYAEYALVDNVGIFLKLRNALNEEYYEVKGYKAYGRRWFAGFYFR